MAYLNTWTPTVYNVLTAAQLQQVNDNIDWLHTKVTGGAANPGAPAAGDIYFRTDLGLWIYYDGTRWLTTNEYRVGLPYMNPAINTYGDPVRITISPVAWFTHIDFSTFVAGTNNGGNYWTLAVYSENIGLTAGTSIYTFNTAADAVNVGVAHDGVAADNNPANQSHLLVAADKFGGPGTCRCACAVYYRLIIT